MRDDDKSYFTLVFEGDITQFKSNPLKMETPFGIPFACSLGNALDIIEDLHEVDEAAHQLRLALNRYCDR